MSHSSMYRFRYVVPFFHYSNDPTSDSSVLINRALRQHVGWAPCNVDVYEENDLYEFVLHSMDGAFAFKTPKKNREKDNNYICSVWKDQRIEKSDCRYINREHGKNVVIDFDLINVELYLFWNHVGLLCYEAAIDSTTASPALQISDLCEFQHHLTELGQRQNKVLFGEPLSENSYENSVFINPPFPKEDKKDKNGKANKAENPLITLVNQNAEKKYILSENLSANGAYFDIKNETYHTNEIFVDSAHTYLTVYKALNIGLWIDFMLSEISKDASIQIDYVTSIVPFFGDSQKHIADKVIPFTYAILKPTALDESATTFKLANGYPLKYNYINNPGEFWEHSSGVLWYASRQGCCCTVSDNINNSYTDYFKNKIHSGKKDSYFLLFLLLLNQEYGLVYYNKLITERLPTSVCSYTKESALLQKILQNIHADINLFLMKSTYTSISTIQKQNEFFSYLRNQLNLEQDIQSIQAGLEGLNELQNSLINTMKLPV